MESYRHTFHVASLGLFIMFHLYMLIFYKGRNYLEILKVVRWIYFLTVEPLLEWRVGLIQYLIAAEMAVTFGLDVFRDFKRSLYEEMD